MSNAAFAAIVPVIALQMAWVTPAMAAGIWTPEADVPSVGTGVEGMSVGVDDAFIVAAYGYDSGDTNTTRVYSMAAGTWSLGALAPLPARSEGIGVLRDGKLYSIGGRNSIAGVVLNNLDRYHKNTNTWVSLAPMPTPRAGLGGAYSGRYIYAIGGRDGLTPCTGVALATVERYDTQTDTWATMAALPAARSDLGALAMGNGKIYVFGGCEFNAVVGDVFVYSIATNSWSSAQSMPTPRAMFYQVGFAGPKIYVMGGADSTLTVSPLNEVYNTSTNTWSVDTPMTTPRGEMGVGSVGGTIWTVGGAVPAFGISENALETFDP
jgi:N-acetylneuraminic acid mutarotase